MSEATFKIGKIQSVKDIKFETRQRSSKYDPVVEAANELEVGQAFSIELPNDFETKSDKDEEPIKTFQTLVRQALQGRADDSPDTTLSIRILNDKEIIVSRKEKTRGKKGEDDDNPTAAPKKGAAKKGTAKKGLLS